MPRQSASFPPISELAICFAHVAYQMKTAFARRNTGIAHVQTWNLEDTRTRLPEADVLVISGLWQDDLLEAAPRLHYIQSIGAGYDQFPLEELRRRNIRLSNARGVNRNAVSDHTFALILGLTRQIHQARDHQKQRFWRPMISDIPAREDELAGKTLGIIGMGHIGSRVARLGKAFEMRVVATKRDPSTCEGPADEVLPAARLDELLAQADVVVLNCPLTPETRGLIDRNALEKMKPSAFLINVARGACVDEEALIEALRHNTIAGAGLDTFEGETPAGDSPFWDLENAIITPHSAGETRAYESNVIDILMENIARLERGEQELLNQIV